MNIFNLPLLPLYCFPSLGKKCLIRPKTCRKIKIRNAWGYKWIGLWTVGIQISKVKNQLELLCTKKNGHNVFNLSSGGSVMWSVSFLSDVLSFLANLTEHRQCESEDKSEVFVTWPQNRSVVWLCTRRILNLWVAYNLWLRKYNVFKMSCDNRIEVSRDFFGTYSWGVSTLLSLASTGLVKVEIYRFLLVTWWLGQCVTWLCGWGPLTQVTTLLSLGFIDLVKLKI